MPDLRSLITAFHPYEHALLRVVCELMLNIPCTHVASVLEDCKVHYHTAQTRGLSSLTRLHLSRHSPVKESEQPCHHQSDGRIGTDSQTGILATGVPSAMCVQRLDDSQECADRITFRISLRSSSLQEPRDPLLKVVLEFPHYVKSPTYILVRSTYTRRQTPQRSPPARIGARQAASHWIC